MLSGLHASMLPMRSITSSKDALDTSSALLPGAPTETRKSFFCGMRVSLRQEPMVASFSTSDHPTCTRVSTEHKPRALTRPLFSAFPFGTRDSTKMPAPPGREARTIPCEKKEKTSQARLSPNELCSAIHDRRQHHNAALHAHQWTLQLDNDPLRVLH